MPNQLIHQTSPYLLQHAYNHVDWHAWNDQSLKLAEQQSKPILLSIGYAACHWCHVMAHESFENADIASLMNQNFFCIKVDREERPDLDKIYQLAHQMLTQRPGGWPLTMALTPQGHAPFFAGTYFPPERRFNLPGFGDLLKKVAAHFEENSDRLCDHHLSFNRALEKLNPQKSASQIPDARIALSNAVTALEKQFDIEYGGFGDAPKFPHPSQLELLLLASEDETFSNKTPAQEMTIKTLDAIANGGLFDQLSGGFFRYSVDRQWKIPHFEKMGYDNAQLLNLYTNGAAIFSNLRYADVACATANWIITEIQQPTGGYAATLDADSEGEEGKFYIWSETDLRALLTDQEYTAIENYFGLFGDENFEGRWHFNINPEANLDLLRENPDILLTIEEAKSKLLNIRNERIHPALDDKIITAWNGMMIGGMAKAGNQLQQPEFIKSAQKAADFMRKNVWQGNRLLSICTQGQAHLNGYLDDYAFTLNGLLALLQAKWRASDLDFAIGICDAMLTRFEDQEKGGFYFTSHDHEKLLYRSKSGADDAIPSGNGAAILGLIKLGNLLGEIRYLQSASDALQLFADDLQNHPSINGLMTSALQFSNNQNTIVIIRGDKEELNRWQYFCNYHRKYTTDIYAIPNDSRGLPKNIADKKATGNTIAYVCRGMTCFPPIRNLEKLKDYL